MLVRIHALVVVSWLLPVVSVSEVTAQEMPTETKARVRGMLLGSLIGDAAGGPVEFKSPDDLKKWLPDLRSWSADRFRKGLESGELAEQFKLLPYKGIRPDVAPYGPWEKAAVAGTVTDDSRHKIILMNCVRDFVEQDPSSPLTQQSLARAYVQFAETAAIRTRQDYVALTDESFKEYHAAARWILGERDLEKAFPPQRLWAGIATCSGQMTLLPLAGVYPGDPDSAYRAAFAIDFVDVGSAKDINSALVAGLASAIGATNKLPRERWDAVLTSIRETDPYRYADVPFAKRPATEWLDFAVSVAERANGSPRELFNILEKEGRAKYYWDAHFTFASAVAFLKFCDFQPLEAITVSLVFGHDTDSAAQVIGALAGAVHGSEVFPVTARTQVEERLAADYGQDLDEWLNVLSRLSDRERFETVVQFVENSK